MSEVPTTNAVALVRSELAAIVGPLVELVEKLNATIVEREAELAGLRETRHEAERAIRAADPSALPERPKPGPKPKPTRTKGDPTKVADDTLARIIEWMEARRGELTNGNGFTAAGIIARDDFDLVSRPTMNNAMKQLHERGVIRLTRRGQGGSKIYVLV